MTILNTQSSWNVGRPGAQCASCGMALLPNQGCWAALCERMAGVSAEAGNAGKQQASTKQEDSHAGSSPFVRMDFCEKCWDKGKRPQGAGYGGAVMFSHWKTLIPVPEQKKRLLVEDSVLVDLFQRMQDRTEPQEVRFRFVLALILMRKRLLKYEGMEEIHSSPAASRTEPVVGMMPHSEPRTQDSARPEVWLMRLRGTEDTISVVNPHLNEEQIGEVSGQLSSILAEEV